MECYILPQLCWSGIFLSTIQQNELIENSFELLHWLHIVSDISLSFTDFVNASGSVAVPLPKTDETVP